MGCSLYKTCPFINKFGVLKKISIPSNADIIESLNALEDWRKKFNDNHYGLGYDQYCTNERHYYPEAYGLWGNGSIKIYNFTHNENFLESAIVCADWLYNNANKKYKYLSWGLPWEWKGRLQYYSYITTSVFIGNFFIELYKTTQNRKYLNYAHSVGDWIVEECGIEENENEAWFYYSDHPTLHKPIVNAISLGSGFFSNLYKITNKEKYEVLSRKSTIYVVNNQNPNGSWYYEEESKIIDNVHIGYTIEGLCNVYNSIPSMKEEVRSALIKANNFYWYKLYTPRGSGKLFIPSTLTSKIKYSILRRNEARLWGYATAIRAFNRLSIILETPNKGLIIAGYVMKNLQTLEGGFKFKTKDKCFYIRHEAHIYDALATLISRNDL